MDKRKSSGRGREETRISGAGNKGVNPGSANIEEAVGKNAHGDCGKDGCGSAGMGVEPGGAGGLDAGRVGIGQGGCGGMKDRLKLLRGMYGLTQEQFAAKIGIKRNSYANYEVGRNTPIDAILHAIAREFGVYETWLRSGEGEMFRPLAEEERIGEWVRDVFADEGAVFQQRFVKMLSELSPDQWRALEAYAVFLAGPAPDGEEKKK